VATESTPKNPFQSTLNLPRTEFSIRANAQQKEPELLKRWDAPGFYEQVTHHNKGAQKFILHDGPPFANGHLHMGHALSYILNDLVCKSKRMAGYHAPLIPGWDCHGLPIELKVTTERGLEKDRTAIDRVTFKKYCREYAQEWIKIQRQELKELGKLADYDHAYVTMNPKYEALILQAFATFVENGYIERKLKTVPWCASCRTVLATAEIEYKDRKDPSLYVLFRLPDQTARVIFPLLFEKNPNLKISLAVWTTTPWTLPLNRAVVLNPSAVYSVLQGKEANVAFVVAAERVDAVCADLGLAKDELAQADAIVFDNRRVIHPLIDDFTVPVLLDETVLLAEGTACLHSAPGCGPEDYLLGIKHGLEIFSPLSDDGKYLQGIKPASLEGMSIVDAQGAVITMLKERETLLHKGSLMHSYPHCWRCHQGLMFRATSQWFCDLAKNDLLARALKEIEQIQFVPERAQARLHSFIANRSEWCISRQRQWGVPITAITCKKCGTAYLDASLVRAVADRVATEGIEFWDRMTPELLAQEKIIPVSYCCAKCQNKELNLFDLDHDILDVWFDSGVSSYAVLAQDKENLGVPADVYFEGSDQHRGWFQSSLLCGMVLYGHTPTKAIVTHGFIVDENKRKMSKSLGNVISVTDVTTKFSRDVLRLWAASVDFENDLVVSDKLLVTVAEMYRKIRNTCRYMIANLYDFDITKDAVEYEQLWTLDQYALARLYELNTKIREAYDAYHFSAVVHTINEYCTNDLSAVYFDILKDRLYVEQPDGIARRSAQTALYHILDVTTRWLAPILSFLAEEVSDFYQKDKKQSIHLQALPILRDMWSHVSGLSMVGQGQWIMLESLRAAVLKAIEGQREQGVIKHPYEAEVVLWIDPAASEHALFSALLRSLEDKHEETLRFLADWFVVSKVIIATEPQDLGPSLVTWARVGIQRVHGAKCPRCWHFDAVDHPDNLCGRCQKVLEKK
jgi:isoleucyl-tRNA synthetase